MMRAGSQLVSLVSRLNLHLALVISLVASTVISQASTLNTGTTSDDRASQLINSVVQQVQQNQVTPRATGSKNASVEDKISLPVPAIKPLIQAALSVGQTGINNGPLPQPQKPPVQQQVQSSAPSKTISTDVTNASPPITNHLTNLDEPIVQLDYSSINDEVLLKRTANFVYFNANFNSCRHCQHFYSTWKDLAIDVRWWRNIVKFFVINCSEEDNIEVCRRAGVTQFPQVKFYWIMSNSLGQDGQRLRILGKSVHAMRHLITDKIVESYQEHTKLLAQRNQNPLGAMNGILSSLSASSSASGFKTSSNGPQDQSSLTSMLPMLGQLFGGQQQGSSSHSSSSVGGLMQAFGIGKSSKSDGALSSSPVSNLLSGAHLNLQSIGQLMSALTGVKTMQRKLQLKPIPNNWPDIEQIEVSETQKLLDLLPSDAGKNGYGSLLIMETSDFPYTGLEVMFDLNPYSNQTYIARVKDDKSLLSKNLTGRDDIQAPAVLYVTNSRQVKLIMTAPKYTDDEDLRRIFVKAFERRQIKYPLKRVWFTSASDPRSTGSSSVDGSDDENVTQRSNQVFMNDLVNAIRASLMEQVFRHPDLSDDQYYALVRYVYTLINYFPFGDDESLKFFKRLHTWLQNQVSPVDISAYKKQFHDIDEVFKQREWIACKSLSNSNAVPAKSRRSGLFDNPAQLGKVVSNFTRMLRGQTKQIANLKNLFNSFTSNTGPVMLTKTQGGANKLGAGIKSNSSSWMSRDFLSSTFGSSKRSEDASHDSKANDCPESPIDRIIKSLTSGSLGSDSSLLKLISAALTGGSNSTKSKFAREYPCGMWKLAHVLVVNEYIKDSPRRDVKHIVLQSLNQYMLNFYACSTCGNRVIDVSNEVKVAFDSPQDQADSVMMLWKYHNRVNKRLESEIRPGTPIKQQFPSESLCPKCRSPRTQNDLVSTPNWNEKQVLNFLVHNYRPQSIISVLSESTTSESSSSSSLTLTLVNLQVNVVITILCLSRVFSELKITI